MMNRLKRRPAAPTVRGRLCRGLAVLALLPFGARGEAPPRDAQFEQWMQLERERLKLDVQTEQLEAERLALTAERERMLREIEALRRETETLRKQLDDARNAERNPRPPGAWLVLEPATGRAEDGRDVVLAEMSLVELLDRPAPDQIAVRHEGRRVVIPASSAAEAARVRDNLAARRNELFEAQEARKKQRTVLEQELKAQESQPAAARDPGGEALRQRKAAWVALREEEETTRIRIDRLDRLLQRIDDLLKSGGAPDAP